jgi:hypothetical protein
MNRITVLGKNNGQDDSSANPTEHAYKLPSIPTQNPKIAKAASSGSAARRASLKGADDFTEDEMNEIRKRFKDFDLDQNGVLEAEEFITLCEHIGLARDRALRLSIMYDEDGDGVIDFSEFLKRDILTDLVAATEKGKRSLTGFEAEEKEDDSDERNKTHVNVAKILQVVRAKMDNSKIAFAFGRYLVFVILYVYVAFHHRSPSDSVRLNSALTNYFVTSQYRDPRAQGLYTLLDITTVERKCIFALS